MELTFERQEKRYFWIYKAAYWLAVIPICTFGGSEVLSGIDLIYFKICAIAVAVIFIGVKTFSVLFNFWISQKYFYFNRVSELLMFMTMSMVFENQKWHYLAMLIPLVHTAYSRGSKYAIWLMSYLLSAQMIFQMFYYFYFGDLLKNSLINNSNKIQDYFVISNLIYHINPLWLQFFVNNAKIFVYYLIMMLVTLVVYKVTFKQHEKISGTKSVNTCIPEIDITRKDDMVEKLKENSSMMDDSIDTLAESNAQLYTLQMAVRRISAILNIKELCEVTNDIILGVLGVCNSSILIYDKKKSKFRLAATTIKDMTEIAIMSDNLSTELLNNVLESQEGFFDNFVKGKNFAFIEKRDVGSMMLTPIYGEFSRTGMFLLEHKVNDYFDDSKKKFMEVLSQQFIISFEKIELYNKMQEMALQDGLTGIFNRVYFQKRLCDEIEKAKSFQSEISLVVLDIDHFKNFNDTYGHIFGDKVIRHLVDVIKSKLRRTDIFARFGGEEFVIIFPNTGKKETLIRTDEIRQVLAQTKLNYENNNVGITASFGIASYPVDADSSDALIRAADDALYVAKHSGRNCVKLFEMKVTKVDEIAYTEM